MSRHPELYRWQAQLASRFPTLPPVFVALLALWSFGMILARRCGLDSVVCHLAPLLGHQDNTVRQRLREFYQEKEAKAGAKRGDVRTDFDVTACFAPLLRWLLSLWPGTRLALALDVTNLGDRFHVLCASVLYGGIGIPVAWKVLPANQKGAWHPHWCALLELLRPVVPAGWTVVVLSDRGLESAPLFRAIVAVGWHPLMRVKAAGKFRPAGWAGWHRFGSLAPRVGSRFAAAGLAYKTAAEPLACTLLACWEAGHEEPWLLLTDLAVASASPCWYAFRAWVEQGFKVVKSGALNWQHTRMGKAERAERLWLAIAVTVLWLVVLGAAVEGDRRRETLGEGRLRGPAAAARRAAAVQRRHRLFVVGLAAWLAAQVCGRPLPHGQLAPEPWPEVWHDIPTVTEREVQFEVTLPL
jgi:hypothetical protein